jgi:hypothetical protein
MRKRCCGTCQHWERARLNRKTSYNGERGMMGNCRVKIPAIVKEFCGTWVHATFGEDCEAWCPSSGRRMPRPSK